MIGKSVDGTYTNNNIVVSYIKKAALVIGICGLLLAVISIMSGNSWAAGGAFAIIAICTLSYLAIDKFIHFKPKNCKIRFDSADKGVLSINISGDDIEEKQVFSRIGTWNRDTFIITLIDDDGGAITFSGNKNDFKLLKQEDVNMSIESNG